MTISGMRMGLRALSALAIFAIGCTGTIEPLGANGAGPNGDGNGAAPGNGNGTGSTKGSGAGGRGNGSTSGAGAESGSGAGTGTDPGDPSDPGAACESGVTEAGPAPLARLTTIEYRNTIAALFPGSGLTVTDYALPAEVATEGFTNTADTQTPSAALIEAISNNAQSIAASVTSDLTKLLPCSPKNTGEEASCGHSFIHDFGRRAFRGDFDAAAEADYASFFDTSRTDWGFATAVSMVVESMLQSPKFLYRQEAGTASGTAVKLDSREIANRLAYFLTDSMPDDALLAAAEKDELDDPAGIETQARRLLGGAAMRTAVSTFTGQWLRFDKMDALVKAPDLFPSFNTGTATALKQATAQYVDHLIWDEGQNLRALLTDNHAYVNAELAAIYDVAAPSGSGLSLVEVDATTRSGILTQAGLLAGFAHERTGAPVLRGVFVLDRLLCTPPPAPPKGVNTVLPELSKATGLTTRQQLEQSHVNADCAHCHDAIDGVGFGFEKFDAIGKFRTTEFDLPVDDSGELRGTDVDGAFEGAVELGQKLADSAEVRECVASQTLRYALAAQRKSVDHCMVDGVTRAFAASGDDFRELFIAVVKSDAFRFRKAE